MNIREWGIRWRQRWPAVEVAKGAHSPPALPVVATFSYRSIPSLLESSLVNIKNNVFCVKLCAATGRITADNLPFFRLHILPVSPS